MVFLTRGPSEVTVDDAVSNYRAEPGARQPAAEAGRPAEQKQAKQKPARKAGAVARAPEERAAPAPARSAQDAYAAPRPGVYVFATSGYEETDALAGQRHTYPQSTSMTVRRTDCGWTGRWQPLKERWEENVMCEHPSGTEMARYVMYHEFFRRGQTEDFACPRSLVQRAGAKPGDRWTFQCKSRNTTATARASVVGIENVAVGGRNVRAMHLHYDITASGANNGKLTQDRWIALGSERFMVRMIQRADLKTQSPFGQVGYKESFRLDLTSLDPRT